jgi:hypothetical protein
MGGPTSYSAKVLGFGADTRTANEWRERGIQRHAEVAGNGNCLDVYDIDGARRAEQCVALAHSRRPESQRTKFTCSRPHPCGSYVRKRVPERHRAAGEAQGDRGRGST